MENALSLLRHFRGPVDTAEEKKRLPEVAPVSSMSLAEFAKQDLAILVRSYLFGDDFYLVSNRECQDRLDSECVAYLPEELGLIADLSLSSLKHLHSLKKKFGGEIVGRKSI